MILIEAVSCPESDGHRLDENLQKPIQDRCKNGIA